MRAAALSPWLLLAAGLAARPAARGARRRAARRPRVRFPTPRGAARRRRRRAAARRRLVLGAPALVVARADRRSRSRGRRRAPPRPRCTARASTSCSRSTSRAACWPRTSRSTTERASRLDAVKAVVQRVRRGARPRTAIGLVLFAARAYTQCPLTLDHGWLLPEPRARADRHDRGRHRGRLRRSRRR